MPTVSDVHMPGIMAAEEDANLKALRDLKAYLEELLAQFEKSAGELVTVSKPLPDEHAARQADPGRFTELRRKNAVFGAGIDVIYGILDGKSVVQSIRFDAAKFTPEEARAWLKAHDFATNLEAASKVAKNALCVQCGQVFEDDDGTYHVTERGIMCQACFAAQAAAVMDQSEVAKQLNVIDRLISTIHREFTVQADFMYGDGVYGQEERKTLSHAIGVALDAFNEIIDAQLPHLRHVNPATNVDVMPTFKADIVSVGKNMDGLDEERVAYAIAYPVMPEGWSDSQHDRMDASEIRKAAHRWMQESKHYDIQHTILDVPAEEATVVESFLAPMDMDWPLPDGTTKHINKGSWIVATKFGPTLWAKVKSGFINAYSIRGYGVRTKREKVN